MFKKMAFLSLMALLSASVTASIAPLSDIVPLSDNVPLSGIVPLSDNAPDVYKVKKGDTLWAIATLYFDKPWHWPKLWKKNPNINNPHLIYPNDVLRLTYINGKPRLQLSKAAQASEPKNKELSNERNDNVEIWPINSAPQSLLRQYLTYDTLIDESEITQVPRVLGSQEGWYYLSMRAPFYVDMPIEHEQWFIYRLVTRFERQVGEKTVKMVSLRKVAEAKLIAVMDEISEMKLVKQTQEVKPNDILLPAVTSKTGDVFHPRAAPSGLSGNMVGHLYGSKYVGLRQIVVVDLGLEDGLGAGDTLSAQSPSSSLKGGRGRMRYIKSIDNDVESVVTQLPARSVGTLLVIHSYPHFSLAMVADAKQPLSIPMTVISVGG